MSYLEYTVRRVPSGVRKLAYINWPLVVLICAVAAFGMLMLYSAAGGSLRPWALAQLQRFALGMALMFAVALTPVRIWRDSAFLLYGIGLALLVAVEFFGTVGMGAQRWIDLGVMRLQPSELMKIGVILALASFYDWLPGERVSHPLWVGAALLLILLPAGLVLRQPDLGTALLIILAGGAVMFLAGVSWLYFGAAIAAGAGAVAAVFLSRGTEWQVLKDYQYRRIDTFLDPSSDPLGAGYHITQSMIALGSGGWDGRGFLQGTQSRLNFLPEKQTDFIFTSLAEEFGFVGGISLLMLYVGIVVLCMGAGLAHRDRFSALLTHGLTVNFFLYFAVNMAMVMGLAPVVGVPLPLVSYGGSAMLVLLIGFGLIQSAHVHRPR
ncbi:MAG: rod shape-determining protein RodA [Alphaproteobacteria bacterium]|nr:MAG: rod shape-determining protein RodA [Alphaproteobacteria bacterium]